MAHLAQSKQLSLIDNSSFHDSILSGTCGYLELDSCEP